LQIGARQDPRASVDENERQAAYLPLSEGLHQPISHSKPTSWASGSMVDVMVSLSNENWMACAVRLLPLARIHARPADPRRRRTGR
jgi:hypothetical protein